MKRFLGILVSLAVVGVLGWQIYKKVTESQQDPFRPQGNAIVAVETVPVRKITIRDAGLFTGTLLPESQFIVAPKVAGRLEKLMVNIGDRVKRGQLIAVLEDAEYNQQVEQAKAELDVARASVQESSSTMEVAQREFERAEVLRRKKIASESELDLAQTDYNVKAAKYRVALAQVQQREAALEAAQIRLSYTQIQAAWEDTDEYRVVGERFVDEGALLAPNTPIVSVLAIDPLKALIHVIERDYSRVQTGQEAVVSTDAFPGTTFTGQIVRIAPLLKETSRQARVEIEIPNGDQRLKPGMFIRAQIEFDRHDDATVVPVAALARRDGRQGVFLVDTENLKARFVAVTVGIVNNELAEVLQPPISGSVVTLGQHLLEDGSAITLSSMEGPGAPAQPGKPNATTRGAQAHPGVKR